jgi:transcriptional regulator with XRE-family HTH domain
VPVDVELPVFARRLRFARERLGISQRELGRRIGMDPNKGGPRINQYENGVHLPHPETAEAIAKELGVPVAYLFADSERLARLILAFAQMSAADQERVLRDVEAGCAPRK